MFLNQIGDFYTTQLIILVVGVPLSGTYYAVPPKEFIADHPFIFYIKVKDLVIFAGRVVDPSQ